MGFDPDKFRMANAVKQKSVHSPHDNGKTNTTEDVISSFVSSELSSKADVVAKQKKEMYDDIATRDIDEFLAENEEDDDLLYQELSRPTSKGYNAVNPIDDESMTYIDGIKESVRDKEVNAIMDDADEQLMDAILSLDLEA